MTKSVAMFISGHSLVDDPLPQQLAAISKSVGRTLEWNKQTAAGSPIVQRTRGVPESGDPLSGYRSGANRGGENLDVLAEFRAPRTVSAPQYDILLITEQHGVLGNLMWNGTPGALRDYHDRFIEANPRGRTFFFEPWLNVDQLDDPRRWIEFTRSESKVWSCVTSIVNSSLAARDRADRIVNIPAGVAIAELVERSLSGAGVPGLTGSDPLQTVRRIFADDVHLTELGVYYVALFVHSSIFQPEQLGTELPLPEGVSQDLAASLAAIAKDVVRQHYSPYLPVPKSSCAQVAGGEFSREYWSYFRDIRFVKEEFAPLAYGRAWRLDRRWRKLIDPGNPENPLRLE